MFQKLTTHFRHLFPLFSTGGFFSITQLKSQLWLQATAWYTTWMHSDIILNVYGDMYHPVNCTLCPSQSPHINRDVCVDVCAYS